MLISVENIRVFEGKHDVPIRPLTIIAGENSSGKSTLLAAIAAIYDPGSFPLQPNFNIPPFNLGSFDTIVTETASRGNAKVIGLGLTAQSVEHHRIKGTRALSAAASYVGDSGQLSLNRFYISDDEIELEITVGSSKNKDRHVQYTFQSRNKNNGHDDIKGDFTIPRRLFSASSSLANLFIYGLDQKGDDVLARREFGSFLQLLRPLTSYSALSIAPIRTKPRRTYDGLAVDYQPEGDHVPFTLARIWSESDAREKEAVIEALTAFGNGSGMFESVHPKAYGDKPGDPFQIQVVVAGKASNLIDVGYGISQSLPIVVQTILSRENNILLLQQPEVHLHPRAQAALGTFFAEITAERKQTMVIETHSDYIVDRIRQEIAKGTIDNADVQLLFIEKKGETSTIHQIQLDRNGNVVDPPPCYRAFFLHEEINLLTRTTPR